MKYTMVLLMAALFLFGGCSLPDWGLGCDSQPDIQPAGTSDTAPQTPAPQKQAVPKPLELLLPQKIRIHQFTETRTFDEAGGVKGIDVRIEATDSFGEPTRMFGDLRFELYTFQPNSQDPKGKLWSVWDIKPSLIDPQENLRYWDANQRMYKFMLQWDKPIPVGKKFVLAAVFSSPFTNRIIAEQVFISGQ